MQAISMREKSNDRSDGWSEREDMMKKGMSKTTIITKKELDRN